MNLSAYVGTLNLLGDESRIRLVRAPARARAQRDRPRPGDGDLAVAACRPTSRACARGGSCATGGRGSARSTPSPRTRCPAPPRPCSTRPTSSADPTLEGDQRRLSALDAERRGALPESFAGEMERHYSPGRTWQSLAVGHRRAPASSATSSTSAPATARPRATSRRTAGRSPASTRTARMIEAATERLARYANVRAEVADVHELPFRAASFDSDPRLSHADVRREAAARARGVRARAPPGRARSSSSRSTPTSSATSPRPTASATPASRPRALADSAHARRPRRDVLRGRVPRGEEAPLPGRAGDRREDRVQRRQERQAGECHAPRHLHPLAALLQERIAIIDGAMGTTIRTYGMKEADIRGERFADSKKDLLNNGDLFSLTQPKMIGDIHRRFLEAGADIIETNTFSATSIGQSEFFVDDPREHGGRKDAAFYEKIIDDPFLNDLAWEINEQSARQCREWADRVGSRGRQAPLRRRRHRPAHGVALELARRRRRRLPRRHVRSGQGRLRAAGPRAHRRRLGRPPRRDHLRLAQRQGGDRRHRGGVRRRTAVACR